MPTIEATAGSAAANSFVTEAEASTYLDGRLNAAAWGTAHEDDQRRALIEATREIDRLAYTGWRTSGTQALSWPRQWAYDPDNPIQVYFGSTVIPQRVKDACCELALEFLRAGTTDIAVADPNEGVIRKKVGPLETQWATARERPAGLERYPRVMRFLGPLLTVRGYQSRIVRG